VAFLALPRPSAEEKILFFLSLTLTFIKDNLAFDDFGKGNIRRTEALNHGD
jgi:hypothetical protein